MTIPLQSEIIYGPLDSRRFGRSLGINLLPTDQKVCNFDCIYCQYGGSELTKPAVFPNLEELKTSLDHFLKEKKELASQIQWIMIAGNGEPTLHPDFPEAIQCLISWRDRSLPGVPIGILSNSSTCHKPDIHVALSRLDGKFMKLDAGSVRAFRDINEPSGAVQWGGMIAGLYRLRNVVLQSLFVTGVAQNVSENLVDEWISVVDYIRPQSVQIYTLDRPPKEEKLKAVSRDVLNQISQRLMKKTSIRGDVFE